jgi:DNA-binding FadR family transcriptional regulator
MGYGQSISVLRMNQESAREPLGKEVVFRPLPSRDAFGETVERLEQAIALGVVQRGERFPPERELIELLHVSRATLREAMRFLQQAGYVATSRGRSGGNVVTAAPEDITDLGTRRLASELGPELFDLLDLRRVLEPGAAELAAERATPEEIAPLLVQAREIARNTQTAFLREHSQLHLGIAKLCHSPPLIAQIAQIHFRLGDALASARLSNAVPSMEDVSHERILNAIGAGDGAEARRLMAAHIFVPDRFFRRQRKPV